MSDAFDQLLSRRLGETDDGFRRLNLEVGALRHRIEVLNMVLSEALDRVGRKDAELAKEITSILENSFLGLLATRSEEEAETLRAALDDVLKRPSAE